MANYNFGNFTKSRIEAFSDGIFAIVVTLLVFDLKFPQIDMATNQKVWEGIVSTFPKLLIWMNSFLIVCVIWMNHHRVMDMFKGIDAGIFWFNNILLMFITLIPYPTSVLGTYPNTNSATCFYGAVLGIASLAFAALRIYVGRHKDLLKDEVNVKTFNHGTLLACIYGPGFYTLGALLSLIQPWMGVVIYTFIPIYFIFPRATQTK